LVQYCRCQSTAGVRFHKDGANVLLVRNANLRLRADLDLTLDGPLDRLLAAGTIGLRNSRVTQSIDLLGALEGGSGFQSQQVGLLIAPFKEGPLADLRFDVQVDTVEPVDLIGNLMRGSVKTSLHLTGTGRGIHPDGAVFVLPTKLTLPGGSLTLTGGSVRFSKANPLFPTLDIYGLTATLYHLLTLRPPHAGDLQQVLVALRYDDPIPAGKLCRGLPRDLAAIAATADILIAAIGRPRFVTAEMVKPAAVVIGLAENVPECGNRSFFVCGFMTSITSARPVRAPTGKPPPIILPRAVRSGVKS